MKNQTNQYDCPMCKSNLPISKARYCGVKLPSGERGIMRFTPAQESYFGYIEGKTK